MRCSPTRRPGSRRITRRILRRLDVLRHAPVGKAGVFVDDMRRNGIALLGPDINASEAEFTVEQTETGHAVRYALAGIRNVGEKAMEAMSPSARRTGLCQPGGPVPPVPPGTMNRRQLEGLAAPARSIASSPTARRCSPMPTCCWRWPMPRRANDQAGRRAVRRRGSCRALAAAGRNRSRGAAPSRWRRSARTSASISPPTRSSNSAWSLRPTARAPMPA
jgi:hypothetical protein